ncbi:hypothetical protein BAE44_0006587 [Dichanthelium oligosanthes]|uniref:Uncharacterized protein n=1 Tax=Dichanthelium oligosanthes TaxID=888268 RepID=A0A1E5W4X3_9POAL|nr:hypothetical protein BAE44_0006587 [Dichanthelium oligosanthes]
MAGDADWSSLPADLLDLISGHLASERDLLHVRHVCAHWHTSVTSRPAAPFRPWVVASCTGPFRQGPTGEYSLWLPRGVRRVEVSDNERSPTRLVLHADSGPAAAGPPRDLGGYSLFLGHGDAFALSAEEHPAIRRNCIYYVMHYGSFLEKRVWAFVFDLQSNFWRKIPFPPEHKENPEKQLWPCSWFCPENPILLKQH